MFRPCLLALVRRWWRFMAERKNPGFQFAPLNFDYCPSPRIIAKCEPMQSFVPPEQAFRVITFARWRPGQNQALAKHDRFEDAQTGR